MFFFFQTRTFDNQIKKWEINKWSKLAMEYLKVNHFSSSSSQKHCDRKKTRQDYSLWRKHNKTLNRMVSEIKLICEEK